MTPQQTRLLERARTAVERSVSLVHVSQQACADAVMIRRVTAELRRRAFVRYIGGAADTGPEQGLRKKLARGTLPRFPATKAVRYGRGEGKACVVCDLLVDLHHREVDVDFDLMLAGMRVTLPFHAACFDAWEKETRTSIA